MLCDEFGAIDISRSVLGPILFLLYGADVKSKHCRTTWCRSTLVILSYNVHCMTHTSTPKAMRLTACLEQLDNWMTSNHVKLNADSTVYMDWNPSAA